MSAPEHWPDLGLVTEARLAIAFGEALLLTATATSALLGIDEKTLRQMTLDGHIASVRVGSKTARYSETCLREYLGSRIVIPKAPSTMGFTEMLARKRARRGA